jgi:peroxiredoxin
MKWLNHLFGGPKDMAALPAGAQAPDFSLPAVADGKAGSKFSLSDALQQGPVVAAFFKISCPVCQYALPYFERLYQAHGSGKVSFVAISQDDQRNTAAFLKEYGITFRTLLDDPKDYAVSNAYGLTNVPTWFLIQQDGTVEMSSVGWVKQDIEDLNRKLSTAEQTSPSSLFHAGEDVRDFRAG